jgi:hypothetical protein
MLRQDLDRDVIQTFLRKTLETMRNADPVLIYLSQPDADGAIRRLFDRRGMSWALYHVGRSDESPFCRNRGLSGIDGLLQYWREHNARAEAMARESGLPTLMLDPREGDWHSRRSAISQFLNLRGNPQMPPLNEANLAHLVGSYRRDTTTFVISLRGDELVLDGMLWPRNPLVPISINVLEAESWPLLLTFLEENSEVRFVRIDGPAIGGRDVAGLYEKVRER